MADIAVVGSLNMDLIARGPRLPRPGETITGLGFLSLPGGKGANQAYAAARLGAQVAMYGCIGDDAHGRALAATLGAAGCDTTRLHVGRAHTGVAVIHVGEQCGDNAIMILPGANAEYDAGKWLGDRDGIGRSRILLLQFEIPLEITLAAARDARAAGVRTIVDPAPAMPVPAGLFDATDILTPNESELARLAGVDAPAGLTEAQLCDAVASVRSRLRGALVVKLGERGCLVCVDGAVTRLPAVPTRVVDTTGAGDVFNGALAVGLLEGRSLLDAATFANHAAALSVSGKGAQAAAPTRRQVDASLQAFQSIPARRQPE